MTGSLDRPSQGALENRKAELEPAVRVRLAWRSVHGAAMALLLARQRSERRRLTLTLSAELAVTDAQERTALRQKYAGRRGGLVQMASAVEREATRTRLAMEEADELALLEAAQRSRRKARRRALKSTMPARHRAERKALQAEQRHQRVLVAIAAPRLRPLDRPRHRTRKAFHHLRKGDARSASARGMKTPFGGSH